MQTTSKAISPPYNALSPARVVLLYVFVGIGWILFSDSAAASFVTDLNQFEHMGILKGIFFIIASAGLLHLLIRYYARQLQSSQETFQLA